MVDTQINGAASTAASVDKVMRVAIVGSGPSGFYAAESLQKQVPGVAIDMFERLHAPYGLVRYGVAPDHAKLKQVTRVFDTVAAKPGFRWFGQVTLGRDISLQDLRLRYHAVIIATGAQGRRSLGISGDDLPGSYSAADFVAWYNGHPDYCDHQFDLSGDTAVVVGQGNVALDVARILLKSVDELALTDISSHAVEALRQSKVRKVVLVGRRGPVQAKFTNKELIEFQGLNDVTAQAWAHELTVNEASQAELDSPTNDEGRHNLAVLHAFAAQTSESQPATPRSIEFRFCVSPSKLLGDDRVNSLVLERTALHGPAFAQEATATGQFETLPCKLVFASVGYKGLPLDGVPFNSRSATIRHLDGRVVDDSGVAQAGMYCTGWVKRGPNGVIGTNRNDSMATVATLLADKQAGLLPTPLGQSDMAELLRGKDVDFVDFKDWARLDAFEKAQGEQRGKPREKLVRAKDVRAARSA